MAAMVASPAAAAMGKASGLSGSGSEAGEGGAWQASTCAFSLAWGH